MTSKCKWPIVKTRSYQVNKRPESSERSCICEKATASLRRKVALHYNPQVAVMTETSNNIGSGGWW